MASTKPSWKGVCVKGCAVADADAATNATANSSGTDRTGGAASDLHHALAVVPARGQDRKETVIPLEHRGIAPETRAYAAAAARPGRHSPCGVSRHNWRVAGQTTVEAETATPQCRLHAMSSDMMEIARDYTSHLLVVPGKVLQYFTGAAAGWGTEGCSSWPAARI
jgi:hypothetical protein